MSKSEPLHDAADASEHGAEGAGTALRLFEQANGMNDFPVLKAFQEYIEAEQARARKRTIGLTVFFVVLLVVVVVAFSVIMAAVINRDQQSLSAIATRNQELSDKLLDIALRERAPAAQPVVNVQQPPAPHPAAEATGAALKPVLDQLETIAANLKPAPAPAPAARPAPTSPEIDAAQRQQDELRRQREAVAAERARLKAEQEKLRQERVEEHRRRLYPDYYAQQDAQAAAALPPPPRPAPVVAPKPIEKPTAKPAPKPAAKPVSVKTSKAISYFDDAEPAPKPAAAKSKPAPAKKPEAKPAASAKKPAKKPEPVKTETLSVGTKGGSTLPWLIELPEEKEDAGTNKK